MNLERLLNRLFKYDLSAALACILLPFVLWIGDGPRSSISDYAYGDISFIYVFLLTVAATLITTIGVRKDQTFTWILGLNLMLIPLTPHLTYPTLHTITSVIFFGGMSYHIIRYSDEFKSFRWFLVGAMVLGFVLHYLINIISLFAAESIAMVIFGVNFLVDLIENKNEL